MIVALTIGFGAMSLILAVTADRLRPGSAAARAERREAQTLYFDEDVACG